MGIKNPEKRLIDCRVCGSSVKKRYPLKDNFTIYHCQNCNSDLTYPAPTFEDIKKSTDSSYFKAFTDPSIKHFKVIDFNRSLSNISLINITSYLDVGCARGYLVDYMLSKNVDSYGIELFPKVAKEAQQLVGKDRVFIGDFETYKFKRKFDLITMFDLIEHVKNPGATLSKASQILNTGGYVLILTPNIDSWKRIIMRQYWTAYHLEHINCFSADTMKYFSGVTGLKLISCNPFHKTVNLRYFVRQLSHKFQFLKFLTIISYLNILNFEFPINDDSMLVIFKNVKK